MKKRKASRGCSERLRKRFDAGDVSAVFSAIQLCGRDKQTLPDWVSKFFWERDWEDRALRALRAMCEEKLATNILLDVEDARAHGARIDFPEIAVRYGTNQTTVKRLLRDIRSKAWVSSPNLPAEDQLQEGHPKRRYTRAPSKRRK